MSLLTERKQVSEAVLEGRFIKSVLQNEAKAIEDDIQQRISGFSSPFWAMRNFSVSDSTMTYKHSAKVRFVDMKTRQSKKGINRKKRHKVHNTPIYGHLNNIIRQLHFGFTEAIKDELYHLENK